MTMVFKYQLCLCTSAEDVLFITLNHIDGIKAFNQDSPEIEPLVDNVYSLFQRHYIGMPLARLQNLRNTLLNFFQDLQIRVSVLLKEGLQRTNGKFSLPRGGPVPYGFRVPGTITAYGSDGNVTRTMKFPTADQYSLPLPSGSLQKDGDRGTNLGMNIYLEHENSERLKSKSVVDVNTNMDVGDKSCSSACEELSFLAKLIGQNADHPEFSLQVFNPCDNSTSSDDTVQSDNSQVVNIDAFHRMEQTTLHRILGELTVEENRETEERDLLELLDFASS